MKCLLNLGECQCIDFAGKIAGFIACDPFELIENVVNNNNQIKAVKQAFDRLDLAGAAA